MPHAVALLDRTSSSALREGLLKLIHALLVPTSAALSDASHRAAALNGGAFVRTGGVQLAVDLIAGWLHFTLSAYGTLMCLEMISWSGP